MTSTTIYVYLSKGRDVPVFWCRTNFDAENKNVVVKASHTFRQKLTIGFGTQYEGWTYQGEFLKYATMQEYQEYILINPPEPPPPPCTCSTYGHCALHCTGCGYLAKQKQKAQQKAQEAQQKAQKEAQMKAQEEAQKKAKEEALLKQAKTNQSPFYSYESFLSYYVEAKEAKLKAQKEANLTMSLTTASNKETICATCGLGVKSCPGHQGVFKWKPVEPTPQTPKPTQIKDTSGYGSYYLSNPYSSYYGYSSYSPMMIDTSHIYELVAENFKAIMQKKSFMTQIIGKVQKMKHDPKPFSHPKNIVYSKSKNPYLIENHPEGDGYIIIPTYKYSYTYNADFDGDEMPKSGSKGDESKSNETKKSDKKAQEENSWQSWKSYQPQKTPIHKNQMISPQYQLQQASESNPYANELKSLISTTDCTLPMAIKALKKTKNIDEAMKLLLKLAIKKPP